MSDNDWSLKVTKNTDESYRNYFSDESLHKRFDKISPFIVKLPSEINNTNFFDALNYVRNSNSKSADKSVQESKLKELNNLNIPAIYLVEIEDPIKNGWLVKGDVGYRFKGVIPDVVFRFDCSKSYGVIVNCCRIDSYGANGKWFHTSQNLNLALFGCAYSGFEIETDGEIRSMYIGFLQDKFKEALINHNMYDVAHDRMYRYDGGNYIAICQKHSP